MSRLLRIVLFWILAFAIPAAGFAASVPPGCGIAAAPASQHDGTAGLAMHVHAHWHEHARNDDAPARTGAAEAEAEAASTSASLASGTSVSVNPTPAASCHACAAHCSTAAMTAGLAPFEPDAPAHHYGATALASTLDVVHGGLERPPRAALL